LVRQVSSTRASRVGKNVPTIIGAPSRVIRGARAPLVEHDPAGHQPVALGDAARITQSARYAIAVGLRHDAQRHRIHRARDQRARGADDLLERVRVVEHRGERAAAGADREVPARRAVGGRDFFVDGQRLDRIEPASAEALGDLEPEQPCAVK
jgi:hypothetical protein